MSPAKELRRVRRRAGLTQAELAGRAGTSQATISAYESGEKTPSLATLERLLAAMGSRLRIASDRAAPPRIPAPELGRRDRVLQDVLALAGALPSEPSPILSYPRLPPAHVIGR